MTGGEPVLSQGRQTPEPGRGPGLAVPGLPDQGPDQTEGDLALDPIEEDPGAQGGGPGLPEGEQDLGPGPSQRRWKDRGCMWRTWTVEPASGT